MKDGKSVRMRRSVDEAKAPEYLSDLKALVARNRGCFSQRHEIIGRLVLSDPTFPVGDESLSQRAGVWRACHRDAHQFAIAS